MTKSFIIPATKHPPDFAAFRNHGLLMRWDEPRVRIIRVTTSRPMNEAERPGKDLS